MCRNLKAGFVDVKCSRHKTCLPFECRLLWEVKAGFVVAKPNIKVHSNLISASCCRKLKAGFVEGKSSHHNAF